MPKYQWSVVVFLVKFVVTSQYDHESTLKKHGIRHGIKDKIKINIYKQSLCGIDTHLHLLKRQFVSNLEINNE